MKLREIFRFEFVYQARRPWPWLAFAVLLAFAFQNTRAGIIPVTLPQDFILNSPFIIASVSVFSCLVWLLVASAMAGEAAARDVQTGMHALTYPSPVSKAAYLGGRFLAALALNALVLLGVQAGSLLGVYAGGVDPAIIGPFRPAAYLAAYAFIALPNAFVATAFQFSVALWSGRSLAAYLGSVILLFCTFPVPMILWLGLGNQQLALLADPIGMFAIMNEMMSNWTLVEKNVRMFTLEGAMLRNRLLWLGLAGATLAASYLRFRFAHRVAGAPWIGLRRRPARRDPAPSGPPRAAVLVPQVRLSFGPGTQWRQLVAIARSSFAMIAKSPGGLFLLVVYPLFVVLVLVVESTQWGVPITPRTGYILAKHVTAGLTHFADYRAIVPLVIIYFAGELIWRERDAGLEETVAATPAPEWVLLLGKLLGLVLVLVALLGSLGAAGVLAQVIMGHHDFQPGLYLQILFGLQLPEYLLFAVLALCLQTLANHKHVGMLATLLVFLLLVFASFLGIEHNLLVYGSSPGWSFTDMRGFGETVRPWLWFKLYWAAWAFLLVLAARLWWVRGKESGLRPRARLARLRCSRATAVTLAATVALILTVGGFVFYNTNVLNEYVTADELVRRRAVYERRYGHYEGIPQPAVVDRRLQVEIHPERGAATIRGRYRLVNRAAVPIDSVHLEPAVGLDTRMGLDRPANLVVADAELGHYVYALAAPLQPGDSLTLSFDVRIAPRGFGNSGIRKSGAGSAIVGNGTYFTSEALPAIGYRPIRELWSASDRRKHGLPRQLTLPPPGDIDPLAAYGEATFEAIVGTDAGQVAVAPGELRRTWSEGGRRYFHYASDVPLNGTEYIFSAAYVVHRERWHGVDLQVYLHPGHTKHRERFLRSARAALDYFSAQFGRYPYPFLQIVEQPGDFLGMGVDGSGVVTGGEGVFLLDPEGAGFDVIFEVAAHELGHQWWGMQLKPAFAEGGGVISEGLAWYSGLQLVKHEKGREALRRFMHFMRAPSPWPVIRTGLPLLHAMDPWANYRKAPFALHALSEYIGEERVNRALRTLIEKHASSLATTLDLYRELQAVTPDSARPLLHDLFEVNTFWSFDTRTATATRLPTGSWEVTLVLDARKVVADSAGRETAVAMTEPVEIGIFAAAGPDEVLGRTLYLQKHRIRSGRQTIKLVVPEQPARGGIDPYNLLDWEEGDNIEGIAVSDGS